MNYSALLSYDPSTGALSWLPRESMNAWNKRFAGRAAGHKAYRSCGKPKAIELSIWGIDYKAHRIAWEITFGALDDGLLIDHANGNPFDNRLVNLRLVTPTQNQWNRKTATNNTSGHTGVHWSVTKSKWQVAIRINSKNTYLGAFEKKEEAIAEYEKAKLNHHTNFNLPNETCR